MDQDKVNAPHAGNDSNWNNRMYRRISSSLLDKSKANRRYSNPHQKQQQNHQNPKQKQQREQEQGQQSFMLNSLSRKDEEDMSDTTVDTAIRSSSMNDNSKSEMGNSGDGSVIQSIVSTCNGTSAGASASTVRISGGTLHYLSKIGEQTMITETEPSRYSPQTSSNQSTVHSSIHPPPNRSTDNKLNSNGFCYLNSHTQPHHPSSGKSVNGRRGRRGNLLMTHKEHQSKSFNTSRPQSRAGAISPQSKTRRRRQSLSLPKYPDTEQMVGENLQTLITKTEFSRYSPQTSSSQSHVHSSIHPPPNRSADDNLNSNGFGNLNCHTQPHHPSLEKSVNGGRGRRGLLMTHKEHQSKSFNTSRTRSRAEEINPQSKTRRRRQSLSLPKYSDLAQMVGKWKREYGNDAYMERNQMSLDAEEGGCHDTGAMTDTGTTITVVRDDNDNGNPLRSLTVVRPTMASPSKLSEMIIKEKSSKTLATCDSATYSTNDTMDMAVTKQSSSITPTTTLNVTNEYRAQIEVELVHLSFELATTKSNADQAYMKMRDYKKQGEHFESIVQTLQHDIDELRIELGEGKVGIEANVVGKSAGASLSGGVVDSNLAHIRSGISTVEESTNSKEEFPCTSSGSTDAAGRLMTARQQQRLPSSSGVVTEGNATVSVSKITSDTVANDGAPLSRVCFDTTTPRKASHNSTNAIVNCMATTTHNDTLQDKSKAANTSTNSILCIPATTIALIHQRKPSNESTDAIVTYASTTSLRHQRKNTLNSMEMLKEEKEQQRLGQNYTTRPTGYSQSATQTDNMQYNKNHPNKAAGGRQTVPQNVSYRSVQSEGGDQYIAEDKLSSSYHEQTDVKEGREKQRYHNNTTTASNRIKLTNTDYSDDGSKSAETDYSDDGSKSAMTDYSDDGSKSAETDYSDDDSKSSAETDYSDDDSKSAETMSTTSRGGNVGSDDEVFCGDPFATVKDYNDDVIVEKILNSTGMSYDLVKRTTAVKKIINNNDYKGEEKVKASSTWSSLLHRRRKSTHKRQQSRKSVKKHRIFGV